MPYTLIPLEVRTVSLDAIGQTVIGVGTATFTSSDKRVLNVGAGANGWKCILTAVKGGEGMTAQLQASFGGILLAACDVTVSPLPTLSATFV